MGIDIHGWVEIRDQDWERIWSGVIKVDNILPRDYDAFGCLFGVMNHANFRPLAPERGLPSDVSDEVTKDFAEWESGTLGYTWIGWQEIKAIDPDEKALDVDQRSHRYRRNAEGTLEFDSKGLFHPIPAGAAAGFTWEEGGYVYRAEILARRDSLTGDWETLFAIMGLLAEAHGDDNVRLVVWFDG